MTVESPRHARRQLLTKVCSRAGGSAFMSVGSPHGIATCLLRKYGRPAGRPYACIKPFSCTWVSLPDMRDCHSLEADDASCRCRVRLPNGAGIRVPLKWTDIVARNDPSGASVRLSAESLLELTYLVESLGSSWTRELLFAGARV